MSEPQTATGRIIIGLQSPAHALFDQPESASWSEETEQRYMEKVRERAQQKAKEILAKAMEEAAALRKQARAEGYSHGQEDARNAAAKETRRMADYLSTIQDALVEEKQRVARAHADQLFHLMRLALEKTLGTVLADERAHVLRTLFDEALSQLQTVDEVTMHVSPVDENLAREIIAATAAHNGAALPPIRIKTSRDIDPGGVRLECGSGMVDNTITSRFEQVQAILDSFQDQL